MKAAGMTHVTVATAGINEASCELYEACGFEPWHLIGDYVKPVQSHREDWVLACQKTRSDP